MTVRRRAGQQGPLLPAWQTGTTLTCVVVVSLVVLDTNRVVVVRFMLVVFVVLAEVFLLEVLLVVLRVLVVVDEGSTA